MQFYSMLRFSYASKTISLVKHDAPLVPSQTTSSLAPSFAHFTQRKLLLLLLFSPHTYSFSCLPTLSNCFCDAARDGLRQHAQLVAFLLHLKSWRFDQFSSPSDWRWQCIAKLDEHGHRHPRQLGVVDASIDRPPSSSCYVLHDNAP